MNQAIGSASMGKDPNQYAQEQAEEISSIKDMFSGDSDSNRAEAKERASMFSLSSNKDAMAEVGHSLRQKDEDQTRKLEEDYEEEREVEADEEDNDRYYRSSSRRY